MESNKKYAHLTFTEIEIHIEVLRKKIAEAISIVQCNLLLKRLAELEEELEQRREHLLK